MRVHVTFVSLLIRICVSAKGFGKVGIENVYKLRHGDLGPKRKLQLAECWAVRRSDALGNSKARSIMQALSSGGQEGMEEREPR